MSNENKQEELVQYSFYLPVRTKTALSAFGRDNGNLTIASTIRAILLEKLKEAGYLSPTPSSPISKN